jgi:adenosylmethionine-8-amino-7-oxononanoate aminotransferase
LILTVLSISQQGDSVVLFQSDILSHVWFPFTHTEDLKEYPPIIFERGKGLYLYDDTGKQYIDAVSSWWVNTLGHCNERIVASVKAQLEKLEHAFMAGCITPPAIQTAERLLQILQPGLTHIFFSDDGSTAVEAGLKMALQYWHTQGINRTEFVSFKGGYHGDTLGDMSIGCINQYHTLFHDTFKKCYYADSPYCYRCPVGCVKETCNAECMDSLEKIFMERGDFIAACIFEPMVQGASGMRMYPAKVLKRIFSLCRKFGVLTIADEVAVGFGRTGKMFACEHANETPDIACMAKGLTGGFLPLAATVVTDAIYAEFCGSEKDNKTFLHGHSFTGNPLGAAAAAATLDILIEQNIPESLAPKMAHFQKKLQDCFANEPCVGDIRSIGLIGALDLVSDRASKKPCDPDSRLAHRICQKAIETGVLIRPLGNVIYFIPPYIITNEEIDTMFDITKTSMRTVTRHA